MPGQKGDTQEKNLQLSTTVRMIQAIYEKKMRCTFSTTNQRRNNYRNGMEYKKEKLQQDFLWARGPEATHRKPRSEYRTEWDKIKIDNLIKL